MRAQLSRDSVISFCDFAVTSYSLIHQRLVKLQLASDFQIKFYLQFYMYMSYIFIYIVYIFLIQIFFVISDA